ncbi:hypothetical protein NFJ02_07g131420 [Pycnococcus provasolii]
MGLLPYVVQRNHQGVNSESQNMNITGKSTSPTKSLPPTMNVNQGKGNQPVFGTLTFESLLSSSAVSDIVGKTSLASSRSNLRSREQQAQRTHKIKAVTQKQAKKDASSLPAAEVVGAKTFVVRGSTPKKGNTATTRAEGEHKVLAQTTTATNEKRQGTGQPSSLSDRLAVRGASSSHRARAATPLVTRPPRAPPASAAAASTVIVASMPTPAPLPPPPRSSPVSVVSGDGAAAGKVLPFAMPALDNKAPVKRLQTPHVTRPVSAAAVRKVEEQIRREQSSAASSASRLRSSAATPTSRVATADVPRTKGGSYDLVDRSGLAAATQAAPMVLNLERLEESTLEVLELELESLAMEEMGSSRTEDGDDDKAANAAEGDEETAEAPTTSAADGGDGVEADSARSESTDEVTAPHSEEPSPSEKVRAGLGGADLVSSAADVS